MLDACLLSGSCPAGRTRAGSGLLRFILLAALLAVSAGIALRPPPGGESFSVAFLGLLAGTGAFGLLAAAAGLIRIARPGEEDALAVAATNAAPEGVVVTGRDGPILYANPAWHRLSGAAEGVGPSSVERVFSRERDSAEIVYRLVEAAREGRCHEEEVRLVNRPDGTPGGGHYRIRVAPLATRRLAAWTISDISDESRHREQAFREFRRAIDDLDQAPAGFLSLGPDGRIAAMNATLAEWLGHDLAEAAARPMRFEALLGNGGLRPFIESNGIRSLDVDLKRRDGGSLPVRLLARSGSAHGRTPPERLIVLQRNTLPGRMTTSHSGEAGFVRAFDKAPFGVAAVDADGRIGQHNAMFARLFGVCRGMGVLDLVGESAELAEALAAATGRRSGIKPVDAPLAGDGARSGRFYLSAPEEETGGAIVFALDMTERRSLEEQVAQGRKMQAVAELAGGIAHDFNNMLTVIIGHCDLLLQGRRPGDPFFTGLMHIKQNTNRATGLVRQLLAFSRQQTLRPQVLALNETLAELSILLKSLLGVNTRINLVQGRGLWPVKADLNQFEQVVVNLAVNARDAMPEGGEFSLVTANVGQRDLAAFNHPELPAAEYVMIEATDTGSGISPEIRDKIFDPFFTTKEVGKGTGLGLSSVYGTVRQTGGYVFADGEPGRGAIFRIFLPRHIPDEADKPLVREISAPIDLTGSGTILLVEDEGPLRALSSHWLTSRGYTVFEAATGNEALAVMRAEGAGIDLVVSDVVMPEMDGPTLLKELRRTRPDLKIIFVSGYAKDAFSRSLADEETFAFLPKPFTLKELAETVKAALG